MIIDFGSRPPLPAFNPTNAAHLANYDVVYGSSFEAAREQVPGVDTRKGCKATQELDRAVNNPGLPGLPGLAPSVVSTAASAAGAEEI